MPTVAQLIDQFDKDFSILVSTGQRSSSTLNWYRYQFMHLVAAVADRPGGKRPVCDLPAEDLHPRDLAGVPWKHAFVAATKALFAWAVDEKLLRDHHWAKIEPPPKEQRNRILTRPEVRLLFFAVSPSFRRFLVVCLHANMRPGEVRQLRWEQIHFDARAIVLTQFKAKSRRRDGKKVRVIPLDGYLTRLLAAMKRRLKPAESDLVFLSDRGTMFSVNAVRCRIRRAREKAGLNDGGELVVCYTLRHTGATRDTRSGLRDRHLADLMGHTSPKMTARYQHLDTGDLVEALDEARQREREKLRQRRDPKPPA